MWDLTVPGNNDHDFYVVAGDAPILVHNNTLGCGDISFGPAPENAWKVLDRIDSKGSPLPGYKGGGIFGNTGTGGGQVLPEFDSAGNQITFREWDVNPYVKGVNRGAQRIVTGSDGSAYYTSDHYQTFTRYR
jgi:guanyl-specific ribonuclease Sa